MDISEEMSSTSFSERCSSNICQSESSSSLSQPPDLPLPVVDISTEAASLSSPQLPDLPLPVVDISKQVASSLHSDRLSLPQNVDLPLPVVDIGKETSSLFSTYNVDLPVPVMDISKETSSLNSSQKVGLPVPVMDISAETSSSQPVGLPLPVVDISAETSSLRLAGHASVNKSLSSVTSFSQQSSSDICPSKPSESFSRELPVPVADIDAELCSLTVTDCDAVSKGMSSVAQSEQCSSNEDQSGSSTRPRDLPVPVADIDTEMCSLQVTDCNTVSKGILSVAQSDQCSSNEDQSLPPESISRPRDLPLPVVDIDAETCSLRVTDCNTASKGMSSVTQSEQCSSNEDPSLPSESAVHEQQENMKSSLVVVRDQAVDRIEDDMETDKSDRPSTVIVISTHRNKEASACSEPELEFTSADVTENGYQDGVHQSLSDLYMCCSEDDVTATESVGDIRNDKQTDGADSSHAESQTENERITDGMPATKCVVAQKQQKYGNGMHLSVLYLLCFNLI